MKKFFQKSHESELNSLRIRIPAYIIALPIVFFMMRAKARSVLFSGIFTLCFAVFLLLSVILELNSYKKDGKFKDDVESGDYYSADTWNENYLDYLNKHGFDKIKGNSMKSDLAGRFRRPFSFIMIVLSLLLLGLCFVPDLQADSGVTLIVGAVIFFAWGMYCLTATPVWKFLKSCQSEANEIENSYMNGRMLTFCYHLKCSI